MSDEVLAWLQLAIDIEKSGHEFYKKILENTDDDRVKELFSWLSDAEVGHGSSLKKLLDKKSGGDMARVKASVEKHNKLGANQLMFTDDDLKVMLDPNTLKMELFNKAAEMEKRGINIYLDLEAKYEDPEMKALFHDLALQELEHKKKISGVSASLLGMPMDEEDEDTSKEALEKELASQKIILKEFTIVAQEGKFTPNSITVDKGDTVHLTVKALGAPAGFVSPSLVINEYISQDKEVNLKFLADTAGEFRFFSNVPCPGGNDNMKGTVIVEGENEPDDDLI